MGPIATMHSFIGRDILVVFIALAILAVLGGIALIVRVAKGRKKIPPPLPTSTEPKGVSKAYEGIRGWLILVALILVSVPISIIGEVSSVFPLLRHQAWIALTTKDSAAYHPLAAPLIVSELIVNIILMALA